MKRQYWLFKSEPEVFSIHDLKRKKKTRWDGVRNYQARNLLRDSIKIGDGVLFYHSNADPPAIVGTAVVVREGYPDHTQFDSSHGHFDPSSVQDNPRWYMVDIAFESIFPHPLSLDELRAEPKLATMNLLRRGNRLSVQPVMETEWKTILRLGSK